jgi:hypothetical protein
MATVLQYLFGNATSADDIPAIASASEDLIASIQSGQSAANASDILTLDQASDVSIAISELQLTYQ